MRLIKFSFLVLMMTCFVASCVKQPEYSNVPHIELLDITFRQGNAAQQIQDTLIFRLKFTDGDGDLGITSSDSNSINSYNPWYYVYDPATLKVLRGTDPNGVIPPGYKLINYHAKKTVPQFDTLPPLVCGSWEQLKDKDSHIVDTIYTKQNAKAYNVTVDVYAKNNAGDYVPYSPANYDFTNCNYNLFRSAFPDLSNGRQTALDGVIIFRITSYSIGTFFNTQTLKMDITINDRAYHVSNVVEKKDFKISQITK